MAADAHRVAAAGTDQVREGRDAITVMRTRWAANPTLKTAARKQQYLEEREAGGSEDLSRFAQSGSPFSGGQGGPRGCLRICCVVKVPASLGGPLPLPYTRRAKAEV